MSEMIATMVKYFVSLLAIAAVAIIASQVFGSNKTQNAMSQQAALVSGITSLYNGQSSVASINPAVAVAAKLAPSDMISGNTLVNPWGGVVGLAVAANTSQYQITQPLVPADACAKWLVGSPSAIAISVNGAAAILPIEAGAAATSCNAATNTIVFTFSR